MANEFMIGETVKHMMDYQRQNTEYKTDDGNYINDRNDSITNAHFLYNFVKRSEFAGIIISVKIVSVISFDAVNMIVRMIGPHMVVIISINEGEEKMIECSAHIADLPYKTYYSTIKEIKEASMNEHFEGKINIDAEYVSDFLACLKICKSINDDSCKFTPDEYYKCKMEFVHAEIEKYYEELAVMLMKDRSISLPIRMIKGVRVKCELKYVIGPNNNGTNSPHIVIYITNPFLPESHDKRCLSMGYCPVYEYDNMAHIIRNGVIPSLCALKYDKVCGFSYPNGEFLPSPTVTDYDICYVCNKATLTKTECRHRLCLPCWAKMPEVLDEFERIGHSCPSCRKLMIEY